MIHLLKRIKCFGSSVVIPFLRMLFYNTICKCWINWLGCKDSRILKYRLSLCLIFKNEAPFLKEWLDFHFMLGVEHFYMYNNNSTDNFREIIQPYIEKGIIRSLNGLMNNLNLWHIKIAMTDFALKLTGYLF